MKKLIFVILILPTLICFTNAQRVESSTKKVYQNPSALISNKRFELLHAFENDNFIEATTLFNELISEIENDVYKAFNYREKWLLSLWFEKFEIPLAEAIQYDELYNEKSYAIFPAKDDYYYRILIKSIDNIQVLENKLHTSGLNKSELDFLFIWLHNAASSIKNEFINKKNVDEEIDHYMNKFTISPYLPFIQAHISNNYIEGKNGVGYHLSGGYGLMFGELKQNIHDLTEIELGLEFTKKQWNFNFSLMMGGSQLKQNIDFGNESWLKDDYTEYFSGSFKPGYNFEIQKGYITPYIGAGLTSFKASSVNIRSDEKYENFGSGLGQSIFTGITYKHLLSITEYPNLTRLRYDKLQWLLYFTVEYQKNFFPDNRFNGDIILFKLGIGNFYDGSYRNM